MHTHPAPYPILMKTASLIYNTTEFCRITTVLFIMLNEIINRILSLKISSLSTNLEIFKKKSLYLRAINAGTLPYCWPHTIRVLHHLARIPSDIIKFPGIGGEGEWILKNSRFEKRVLTKEMLWDRQFFSIFVRPSCTHDTVIYWYIAIAFVRRSKKKKWPVKKKKYIPVYSAPSVRIIKHIRFPYQRTISSLKCKQIKIWFLSPRVYVQVFRTQKVFFIYTQRAGNCGEKLWIDGHQLGIRN